MSYRKSKKDVKAIKSAVVQQDVEPAFDDYEDTVDPVIQPQGKKRTTTTKNKQATRRTGGVADALESLAPRYRRVVIPAWTRKTHARVGHFGGFLLWVVANLVFWPVLAAVIASIVQTIAVSIVPDMATFVASYFGNDLKYLLSGQDVFVFSWMVPVLFMIMALVVAGYGVFKWLCGHCARYSRACALGLFAGYGRGIIADMRLRRKNRPSRAERKREREAKKARKEKVKADIKKARDNDSRL